MGINDTNSSDPELLNRFISLLTSPAPLSLPRQTLLGAISHYISTLPPSELSPLLSAITASPHLWHSPRASRSSREAVRLGIQGALSRLYREPGSSRWWKRRNLGVDWLDQIAGTVLRSEGSGRTDVLVAILVASGAETELAAGRSWKGKKRAEVEDEVIMRLVETLQDTTLADHEVGLELFCEVAEVISGAKLCILNLEDIQRQVLRHLYTTLAPTSRPSDHIIPASHLSRTSARLFEVMFEGDEAHNAAAWVGIWQFCIQMRGVTICLPRLDEDETNTTPNIGARAAFDQHKTALFAFLFPISKALSILLDPSSFSLSSIPSTSNMTIAPRSELALETLHTLSCFAPIIDQSQGGLETYHRVLYGMTDVLVATGGTAAVRTVLSRAPEADSASPAEALWWLTLGESLVRSIDEWGFRSVMEPLIEKYIEDTEHRGTFEAAHSLRLAMIRAAAETYHDQSTRSTTSIRPDEQALNTLLAYCELLLKQHIQGKITQDQLIAAYPMVVHAASEYSITTVNACLAIIRRQLPQDNSSLAQVRRLNLIACAPSIQPIQLRPYLEDLASESTSTAVSPGQKAELANAAYRMVSHDLPESNKGTGIEWWAEWRDRFSGETKEESFIRSRL